MTQVLTNFNNSSVWTVILEPGMSSVNRLISDVEKLVPIMKELTKIVVISILAKKRLINSMHFRTIDAEQITSTYD